MKFFFNDASKRFAPRPFEAEAKNVFKKLEISDKVIELGLNICSNKKIQKLNKNYRHIDQPTDVLSFPIDQPKKHTSQYTVLGDVVISYQEAEKESRELEKPIGEMMITLFRHGLMHLLGYDHDKDKKEWAEIESKLND